MARTARALVPVAVLCAVLAGAIVFAASSGAAHHELYVETADATGIYAGEAVRERGIDVGGVASVKAIDGGRRARVGLTLKHAAWPLGTGARLAQRWGGTISFLGDYLDLTGRGDTAAPYPDHATLPAKALTVSVQFDSLIDAFTPAVRSGLRGLIAHGGSALSAARPGLEHTLTTAPAALAQANLLLGSLNRSRAQLTGLITASAHVTAALDGAQPGVAELVDGAAGTLDATAAQATNLERTIAQAPAALTRVDGALGSADRTLNLADRVTSRLGPGVTALHEALPGVQELLTRIDQVSPDAEQTLTTAGRSAPRITALLTKATTLLPTIGSGVSQGTTQLGCIRPYTPDIVSFFTNWGAFMSVKAGSGYLARVVPSVITGALTGAQQNTPAEAVKTTAGLTDAFPQPPGYAAGQPWFQPQCGITAGVLDPAQDPEANNPATAPLTPTTHTALPAERTR